MPFRFQKLSLAGPVVIVPDVHPDERGLVCELYKKSDFADSGIGGAVAETVGKKISRLSEHCQVICITHLPQVAKFADTHLLVTKTLEDKKTRVEIKSLGREERVGELARMIGGINITEKTIEAAKEMLGN